MLFCAASNRAVMEAIRADYEREFGRSIQIQYGASQTLLSSMEVSGSGDLYLPADDSFLEIAREKGSDCGNVADCPNARCALRFAVTTPNRSTSFPIYCVK